MKSLSSFHGRITFDFFDPTISEEMNADNRSLLNTPEERQKILDLAEQVFKSLSRRL